MKPDAGPDLPAPPSDELSVSETDTPKIDTRRTDSREIDPPLPFWTAADTQPGLSLLARIETNDGYRRAAEHHLGSIADQYELHHAAHELAWDYIHDEEPLGAVEVYRLLIERQPTQARNFLHLADVLLKLERLELALAAVDVVLLAEPRCQESLTLAVKLLGKLGHPWRGHRWPVRPVVAELDASLLERCYEWTREHGALGFLEIQFELLDGEILAFEEDELVAFLEADRRFENIGDSAFPVFALAES